MTSGATRALQSTAPAAPESEPLADCPAHRQPVRYIDLHRSPDRRDYFAHATRGIAFDAGLKCWIIDEPQIALEALNSPALSMLDFAKICARMDEAGYAVPNVAFAYAHLPLCQNGEAHRVKRAAMSRRIAARKKTIETELPDIIDRHLILFGKPGELEVMSQVLQPLVTEIIFKLVDIDAMETATLEALPAAFDRLMGHRKALQVDHEIAEVRARIRDTLGKSGDEPQEGLWLALVMLGRDPLLATLGESLRHIFHLHSETPTNEIAFPAVPPETGVAFVERRAAQDVHFGGHAIRQGDQVRIMLQGFAYSATARDNLRIFGAGAHACLGRPLALEVWNLITAALARMKIRVRYISSSPRLSDYVFACPKHLNVEILNDTA